MSNVLVVDDAPANRLVLVALLRRLGHTVAAAAGVAEALRVCRGDVRPDAVLTDLRMQGDDDGIVLARELRALEGGSAVRIALLTGDAHLVSDEEGLFDAILEKPVSQSELRTFLGEGD